MAAWPSVEFVPARPKKKLGARLRRPGRSFTPSLRSRGPLLSENGLWIDDVQGVRLPP